MQAFENHNVLKPLVLTLKQEEVLNALGHKETEEYPLSRWYLGALYALENHYNPDRVAQAAHSLRELIEKLPRVVHGSDIQGGRPNFSDMRNNINKCLSKDKKHYSNGWKNENINMHFDKTLRQIVTYFELNQQPTRREQMQQAVVTIDPMINSLDSGVRERKLNQLYRLWQKLEGFVHHKSNPDFEEFSKCLKELETIVFDLLAPITAQDQQEIQTILNYPNKSENTLNRMFSLIERRGSNFAFFFKQVSENADVTWLPFLEKKGYFAYPPRVQITDDNSIIYPFWWPIRYLEKISSQASNEVIEIVRQLPQTDNPRVYEGILDIALQLHGEHSVKLKPKMLEYVLLKHHRLPHRFADLLAHWTNVNQTSAALELAEILIAFAPDPRSEEKRKQRSDNADDWREMIGTTLYPVPKCSHWEYSNIMSKGIRPLAEKEPYEVACLLIDTTVNMIRLRTHQGELDKEEDYSDAWCKRVHGQDNNHEYPEKTLVHTLTFACKRVFERSPDKVAALDKALRKPHWNIFKRLRHHLYAQYPNEETKPWIRELILTHEDYGLWEHHYEFQQMIRRACEHFKETVLSEAERPRIFDTILDGPLKENCKHWIVDWLGEEFTEERFQERKQRFHRKQFKPFEVVLFGEYETYYNKLESEAEKLISDDDYPPYEVEVKAVSNHSPRSPKDLTNSTDEDLLDFINDWEKEDEFSVDEPSERVNIETLANAFQSVFRESIIPNADRLEFWIDNRSRIKRPIYVRAIINAMQADVKAKNFNKLNKWLSFGGWVLTHSDRDREVDHKGSDKSRKHPDWSSSRRAVCDFIGTCLEKDVDVPISAREQLAELLELLCTQFDCYLDESKPKILNRYDPLTEGINNTRSLALQELLKFGFWLRGHEPECEVLEVITILEKRFAQETEYPLTLPEYAVLAASYRQIFYLNNTWAAKHRSDFFLQERLPVWLTAFECFINYCQPFKPTFEILQDDFNFALQNLNGFENHEISGRGPIDTLGQHLFTYYLWGMYPLQGKISLLERFYQKTDSKPEHWGNLFRNIGHRLWNSGETLDQDMKDRVLAFFEWRFKKGEPSELKHFTLWLQADCLDVEWRLNAYSRVLDVCEVEDWGLHFKTLCEMLPDHTPRVIECFLKLTKVKKDNVYILLEEAKTILNAGLNSTDERVCQQAVQARENLLREGRFDLLDLEK